MDKCLHANSHHHPLQTLSVVNSLMISPLSHFYFSIWQTQKSLLKNVYSITDIESKIRCCLNPSKMKTNVRKWVAFAPYINQITDHIGMQGSRKTPVFKSTSKISQVHPSHKNKLHPLSSKAVYRIHFICCDIHWYAETSCSIKTRLCEQQRCLKNYPSVKIRCSWTSAWNRHQALLNINCETGYPFLSN